MMTARDVDSRLLDESYAVCMRIARGHYENFPVASFLLPRALRPHVAAVYAYARTADDFADEGDAGAEERLSRLRHWRMRLCDAVEDRPAAAARLVDGEDAIFTALAHTVRSFDIPPQLLLDLLDAFAQDVTTGSYATWDDVIAYCRRSANPIGRIVLALFGRLNGETSPPSDALCTALQLANFWQDIGIDARKSRVYLPEEDLFSFGITREDILTGSGGEAFPRLLRFEVQRTAELFDASRVLFDLVPGRLRVELRATHAGGMRILAKIADQGYTLRQHRVRLSAADMISIMCTSLFSTR